MYYLALIVGDRKVVKKRIKLCMYSILKRRFSSSQFFLYGLYGSLIGICTLLWTGRCCCIMLLCVLLASTLARILSA